MVRGRPARVAGRLGGVAVYLERGWPEKGRQNTLVVTGPAFAGLSPGPRPVRVVLPPFDHCYSFKARARRVAEWAMSAEDVPTVPAASGG